VIGIYFALGGNIGYAIICLMVCGLCDMFDGPLARQFKRTVKEESFGIQIDALADLVSFGVFPAVIGYAVSAHYLTDQTSPMMILNIAAAAIFVLAALTRLAYFNVVEIELHNKKERRKYYEGMPVTFVAILIPLIYSICLNFGVPLSSVYSVMLLAFSVFFVIRVRIPKIRGRYLLIFILIGLPIIAYLIWSIGANI
jgi:CDP-diacylglycerol--serine O-phosphatidyltransferase